MWTFLESQETCVDRAAAGSSLWLESPIFPARSEPLGKEKHQDEGKIMPAQAWDPGKIGRQIKYQQTLFLTQKLCPQKSGATPIFSVAYISSSPIQQHTINTSRLQRPQWESNREANHALWVKIVALKTQPVSAIYITSELRSLENKCWECLRNSKKQWDKQPIKHKSRSNSTASIGLTLNTADSGSILSISYCPLSTAKSNSRVQSQNNL